MSFDLSDDAARALLLERLAVSRETMARLETYVALLRRWQAKINLVSPQTLNAVWSRHILDSAQLAPHLPTGAQRLADFGAGAGFPGLVLAILGAPDVHLVESDARKATFLREAARATGAAVTVHTARAELLAPLAADIITARALASLAALLPYAARHLAPGGICLFLKGENWEQELTEAQATWTMRATAEPSLTHPAAVLLRVDQINHAAR